MVIPEGLWYQQKEVMKKMRMKDKVVNSSVVKAKPCITRTAQLTTIHEAWPTARRRATASDLFRSDMSSSVSPGYWTYCSRMRKSSCCASTGKGVLIPGLLIRNRPCRHRSHASGSSRGGLVYGNPGLRIRKGSIWIPQSSGIPW